MNAFDKNKNKGKGKRTWLLVLGVAIGLFISFDGHAQKETSLLWKVSGNGLSSPSYLYGTIHMICPDDFFLPEGTEEALASSAQVYLEIDMDAPDFNQTAQKVMMMEEGKNILNSISDERTDRLDKWLTENYGAGLTQFGTVKPLGLMSYIYIKQLACAQPASYELKFLELAKAQKKEVMGLETLEYQIGLFDKQPLDEQLDWILYTLDHPDEFENLIAQYKQQDLSALLDVMQTNTSMSDEFEWLLFKRNENWIPVMESAMTAQSTFFGVGAAHLAGDRGVIQMLKDKGYRVEAL